MTIQIRYQDNHSHICFFSFFLTSLHLLILIIIIFLLLIIISRTSLCEGGCLLKHVNKQKGGEGAYVWIFYVIKRIKIEETEVPFFVATCHEMTNSQKDVTTKFNGIFFINREINRRLNPRRNDVIFVRHRMFQYFQDTSVINNKKTTLNLKKETMCFHLIPFSICVCAPFFIQSCF